MPDPPRKLPFRSRRTWLSDDELLLYDAVFDIEFLYLPGFLRDGYSDLWNTWYTHNLSDSEVEDALNSQVAAGFVRRGENTAEGWPTFGLTEVGGNLWAEERAPVWERYCSVWYDLDAELLFVQSPEAETCSDYLRVALECGLHHRTFETSPNPTPVPDSTARSLIPWRSFPAVFEIRIPQVLRDDRVDWASYHRDRTSWGTLSELQKFITGEREFG